MEIIIGVLLLFGGLGLGVALKSDEKPPITLKSELLECRQFCGKGRTLTYDRIDGSCMCVNQKGD